LVSRVKFALGVPVALAADVVVFAVLRRARPRPFGLAAVPPHTPAMLGSYVSEGLRRVTEVVLSYGRPLAVAGPFTVVETCFSLRFVQDSVVVTAVARLGFGERPVFAVFEDLEPYMAEQRRFILSWLRFWEG
jgi:hypothetical protein